MILLSENTQKAFKVVHSCIPSDFFKLIVIPQLVIIVKTAAALLFINLPGVTRCTKNSKT